MCSSAGAPCQDYCCRDGDDDYGYSASCGPSAAAAAAAVRGGDSEIAVGCGDFVPKPRDSVQCGCHCQSSGCAELQIYLSAIVAAAAAVDGPRSRHRRAAYS